jgi:hypothetical protein
MRDRALVFIVASVLGGSGGLLGSIVGNVGGKPGLFAGGLVGGLAGAVIASFIARSRGWIRPERLRSTGIGSAIGFLIAALVATQTLGSPVGPILSTAFVGIGALIGAGRHRDRVV